MYQGSSRFGAMVTDIMQSGSSTGAQLKPGAAGLTALETRVDRQQMLIQTLLILLLEKKVVTEDEFRDWLGYVDGLDGRRDGKLRADTAPKTCPNCGRVSPPQAIRCQYCDHAFEESFIDPRHKRA